MRILVPVKRVIDYAVKVRVKADKTGVDLANVKMSMNPFCEIACEQAVRFMEKGIATEVVAVSIGPKQSQDVLRTALAMGATKGIHIQTDMKTDLELQPLSVAKALREVVKQVDPNLVIVGKQSIDGDSNQTGQMLAGLLDWPQGTFCSDINVEGENLTITREVDAGLQVNTMSLPAVLTADLRLNEPRYVTLPGIMKARKKKIETIKIEDLGVDLAPRLTVLSVEEPSTREAGVLIDSVDELLEKLKNEAKVI